MTRVLFVVSAADRWTLNDGTVHPSGFWAEELAVPHRLFMQAGWGITIATPGGKKPTLDQPSLSYPGGHGPMEDLAYDATSGALLAHRLSSGKPLALLCHAPAAIAATADQSGRSPFAGRRMTGPSNREELLNRFARKAPWLLEDKLKELGVDYSKARLPLRPYVVADGNLYTGQNPQSSEKLAERLIADLGGSAAAA